MVQTLDSKPKQYSTPELCCYVNATNQVQIVRIADIPDSYFERVAFPGQRLMFEAPPEVQLEVHTGHMASAILADRIPCSRLQVRSGSELGI